MHSLLHFFVFYFKLRKERLITSLLTFLLLLPFIVQGYNSISDLEINEIVSYTRFAQEKFDPEIGDSILMRSVDRLEEIVLESERLWLTDKEQSEKLIVSAFEILKQERINDSLQVRVYHVYGKLLVDRRKYIAGIDTLLKCVEIKKRVFGGKNSELANTYNYIGIAYFRLRQYNVAMAYYKKSADVLNKNNQININLFDANLNLGIMSAVKGEFDLSYKYFNSALFVLDSIGSAGDSLLLARFYSNFGLMATMMGKFDDAIKYYTVAESIFKEKDTSDFLSIARLSLNKGTNAYYQYDYSRGKLYYKESLDVLLKNDKTSFAVPKSYNNLCAVSMKTGAFAESVQYGLSGLNHNPDNYIKLLIFQNLAESYAFLGSIERAEYYYVAAIDLLQDGQLNPTKSISLFRSYADFLFDNQKLEESRMYYFKALEMFKSFKQSDSKVYASLLSRLGDYYRYGETDTDSALIFYDQSIAVWNNILNNKGVAQSENFDDIRFLDAYLGKAQVLASQFRELNKLELLKESCDIYKWALDQAVAITSNLDRESQLLLNEKLDRAYDEAVNLTYTLYQETSNNKYKELAFEFAERSKSSVLLAAVQNNNALKTTDVPEYIVQSEQQLQLEINGMKKLLLDEQMKARPLAKKLSFINSRLLLLMNTYDSLVNQIEQSYPRYFALKYDRSVINMSELSEQLRTDEVLLEYVLSDSVLTIFCLDRENNFFFQISVDTVFYDALDQLINVKNFDMSQHSKEDMVVFIQDANVLWEYLIDSVYTQIKDKKLIIVPDGLLGYLSFDLLLSSPNIPDELDYKLLPYLFKEFPLSYSYSSSLRFNSYFQSKETTTHELIAFAPDLKFDKEQASGLSSLPNSLNEAKEVAQIFNRDAYLKEDATKLRFLTDAMDYKIIHLAMHTIINDSLPMLSELLFYGDNGALSDSKMRTYEVFGLDLSAELVVLSACNTGAGQLQKGEGIMSLARGFIYAGVPSIMLTLWEVQDKATAGIMQYFYENLKEGNRKDVALQKAKLDYLSNANRLNSHPYYWSSFIITGKTGNFEENVKHNTSAIVIYSGIFVSILMIWLAFIWIKKERKKLG